MAPRWPKRAPRRAQEGPKKAPRAPQDSPKRAREASKMSPKGPYDGPKRLTRRSQSERSQKDLILTPVVVIVIVAVVVVVFALFSSFLSSSRAQAENANQQLPIISVLRKGGCFWMDCWGVAKRGQFRYARAIILGIIPLPIRPPASFIFPLPSTSSGSSTRFRSPTRSVPSCHLMELPVTPLY